MVETPPMWWRRVRTLPSCHFAVEVLRIRTEDRAPDLVSVVARWPSIPRDGDQGGSQDGDTGSGTLS